MSAPPDWAAIFSAIAASFSAIAAFLTWRSQDQHLSESFKPEVVLGGWARPSVDCVTFTTVKNIGRGTAQPVVINGSDFAAGQSPLYTTSSISLPGLASGEERKVDGCINIVWANVAPSMPSTKTLFIRVNCIYWDALSRRHIVRTGLFVLQHTSPSIQIDGDSIGRGISLGTVQVTISRVGWLKVRRWFWKVPLLSRFKPLEPWERS